MFCQLPKMHGDDPKHAGPLVQQKGQISTFCDPCRATGLHTKAQMFTTASQHSTQTDYPFGTDQANGQCVGLVFNHQGHACTGQKVDLGGFMLHGFAQDLTCNQLSRFANFLQLALIFLGELKDEPVGQ